jgi:hypothetical protein
MTYDVPQILRLGETSFKTLAISHETWKTLLCSLGLAAPPRPSSGLLLCGLTYQALRLEPATGAAYPLVMVNLGKSTIEW